MFHFLRHLLHPLKELWVERIALFWPMWIATTVIGVWLVMWAIPQQANIQANSVPSRHHPPSRATVLAVAFLCLFLICYIAGILVWEDFTYYDNSHYTNETLVGRNVAMQILPEAGRFWPLGYEEFNLIRHVTHSIYGYHAFRIVQLLLLSGILLVLLEELSIQARVALTTLTFITPSILISFGGLIYSEPNILLSFVCLVWFVKRFGETRHTAWAVAAMISSQFMLYFKETAFLLLLGFVISRLLLRCWSVDQARWDINRLRDPESRLDLCLGFPVACFLLYYLAAMFPKYSMGYAHKFQLSLGQTIASYFQLDLLVWVLVAVVLARIFLILRRKTPPSVLWDGLALAGVGCFAGYLDLRMQSTYYLAPVDLIAVLYLGRLAILAFKNMEFRTRLCVLALVSVVLLQDLSVSAFHTYERKNVIRAKAEMARAIKARYQSDPQSVKRLFFPFTQSFHLMEFASYLNYIGVPVEGGSSVLTTSIRMVGKAIQQDGPCGYQPFVCHPGTKPDPGDLVVVLPDDLTSTDELSLYQQEGTRLLFSYHPHPLIPRWLQPEVSRLRVASPVFAREPLPGFWLSASVTVWN